jgi:hypothetical protein
LAMSRASLLEPSIKPFLSLGHPLPSTTELLYRYP